MSEKHDWCEWVERDVCMCSKSLSCIYPERRCAAKNEDELAEAEALRKQEMI